MALLSPYDPNDLIYEEIAQGPCLANRSAPPKTGVQRSPVTLRVKNQGPRPTCTAVAASSLMESFTNNDESAEWIWFHRDDKGFDGMSASESLKILRRIGSIAEELFPYGTEQTPIGANYLETKKIKGYAKIISLEGLKTALENHPVIIVLPLYNYGLEFWIKPAHKRSKKKDTISTYHAVLLIGFTDHGLIIQNSWGKEWGIDGQWIIPFSQFDLIREAWAIAV